MLTCVVPDQLGGGRDAIDGLVEYLSLARTEEIGRDGDLPEELLEVVETLAFQRLDGVSIGRLGPTLPTHLVEGLRAEAGLPFAFRIESNGQRVRLSIGTAPQHSRGLALRAHATLQGPIPRPEDGSGAPFRPAAWAWLAGTPARPAPAADELTAGVASSGADLLLDALWGRPFVYLVLATPERPAQVRAELSRVRRLVETLDRDHLRLPEHQEVNRSARRARELLDLIMTELESAEASGAWRVTTLLGAGTSEEAARGLGALCGRLRERAPRGLPAPRPVVCGSRSGGAATNLLGSERLAALCPLPLRDRAGWAICRDAAFDVDHRVPTPDSLPLGEIIDGGVGVGEQFCTPLRDLSENVFVCGNPGSGKTTTTTQLLRALGRRGVGFLVLEPAKGEYAALLAEAPALDLLRVGVVPEPGELPLQLNPFSFPEGFPLHTHVDLLRHAFVAAFGLMGPAPHLLEEALKRVYEHRGWDFGMGRHPHGHDRLAFPTISDLVEQIDPVVDAAGHHVEIRQNLKAALKTRLRSLTFGPKGLSLDTRDETPASVLFEGTTVIELQQLGSDEEKAFVMGLLVARLHEHRQVQGLANGRLRHLLVIEEAHRLLKNRPERSADEGNMAHQAVEAFANKLAEMRGYGQGVLTVEQIPSKLTPEVVKLAGLKLVHRLAGADDRDLVGDSIGLDESQKRTLLSLARGEFVAHAHGMDGAVRACAPPPRDRASARRRPGARVDGDVQVRLARAVTRATRASVLSAVGVRATADQALLRVLADTRQALSLAELLGAVERVAGEVDDAELADLALEDAVTRVALSHRWAQQRVDDLLRNAREHAPTFGERLRGELSNGIGPLTTCGSCPTPCRFLSFGGRLATDPRFGTDANEASKLPAERWGAALLTATRGAMRRGLAWTGEAPGGLAWCAVAHHLEARDLTPRGRLAVLETVRLSAPSEEETR